MITFNDWYYANRSELKDKSFKDAIEVAWRSAVEFGDNTKADLLKLKQIIKEAEQIECTCDKEYLAQGYSCMCIRQGAMIQATVNLSKFIRDLK